MNSIDGVYSISIDLAGQKLTVVGTAEPEKIVKAIKKTRKIATICSHTEPGAEKPPPPPPVEQAQSSEAPPAEAGNQPPAEAPKVDAPPPQADAAPEVKPSPEAKEAEIVEAKEVSEVHMVHHLPYDRIRKEQLTYLYPQRREIIYEAPYCVSNSYRNYRALPYVPQQYIRYDTNEDGFDHYRRGGGGYAFSEENPNACTIV